MATTGQSVSFQLSRRVSVTLTPHINVILAEIIGFFFIV